MKPGGLELGVSIFIQSLLARLPAEFIAPATVAKPLVTLLLHEVCRCDLMQSVFRMDYGEDPLSNCLKILLLGLFRESQTERFDQSWAMYLRVNRRRKKANGDLDLILHGSSRHRVEIPTESHTRKRGPGMIPIPITCNP